MKEKKLICYTTSLALNRSLVEIEKDKGLDYAEDCCKLLQFTDYYLNETKSKARFYTSDLPTFTNEFRDAVVALPSTEHAHFLPKSDLRSCMETLTDYATNISNEDWVSKWSNDVTKYFQKFSYLVKYAHEKICDNLMMDQMEDSKEAMKKKWGIPRVVVSAPMPFGWDQAFYDGNSDLLVFLTTVLKSTPELYRTKLDRKHGDDPYEGYNLPMKYPELVYLISHEVAHRCVHLSVPKRVDSYLHEKFIEEELCKALALDVMLYRTEIDRKLTRKHVYRLFGKEFGPHYIYLKDRK